MRYVFYAKCRTRVVQKIIEKLRCAEQYLMIVAALKPHIVALIKDSHGSHVAECCFQFPPEYREASAASSYFLTSFLDFRF